MIVEFHLHNYRWFLKNRERNFIIKLFKVFTYSSAYFALCITGGNKDLLNL